MDLRVVNDVEKIRALVSEGFCPVECICGGESVVDKLLMDHHGEHSGLEGVAVRSYRDHFGARSGDQRFVTPAPVDADSAFATAALAGLLPHPSRREALEGKVPPPVLKSLTKDLSCLAETINRVDTDPIGLDLTALKNGPLLLVWQSVTSSNRDDLGYAGCVATWVSLASSAPDRIAGLLDGAKTVEFERRHKALDELREKKVYDEKGVVALLNTEAWGFDVWYGRTTDPDPSKPSSWSAPVVLALVDRTSEITVGCPNKEVAESLLGEGGLKRIFPILEPEGWGGREAIGGSPRGTPMTEGQLVAAARRIAEAIWES